MSEIPDGTILRDAQSRVKLVFTKGSWCRPGTDSQGLPELEPVEDQAAAWREARQLLEARNADH